MGNYFLNCQIYQLCIEAATHLIKWQPHHHFRPIWGTWSMPSPHPYSLNFLPNLHFSLTLHKQQLPLTSSLYQYSTTMPGRGRKKTQESTVGGPNLGSSKKTMRKAHAWYNILCHVQPGKVWGPGRPSRQTTQTIQADHQGRPSRQTIQPTGTCVSTP